MQPNIKVIIPALNEQDSIVKVLKEIPDDLVSEVIVIDNGSKDQTVANARNFGATVLIENEKGYGNACLSGINYLTTKKEAIDIVVFIDGDYSDFPEEMYHVVNPIIDKKADFVVGSREKGSRERGSMTFLQIVGNRFATFLIRILYRGDFSDLGPFRAIKYDSLLSLGMNDRNYGWTVEMQLKAIKIGLNNVEVPVSYRKRIGRSKVSGTIKGTFMAGYKILWTIFKYL